MTTRTLKSGRSIPVHRNDGLRKRCDCARRAWPKCPHPWHFSFKWRDTHHRFPLERFAGRQVRSKDEARAEADRLRAAIRDGVFRPAAALSATTPDALTFEQLASRWRESGDRLHVKPMQRTIDRVMCGRLCGLPVAEGQALGQRMIGSLTEDDIETAFRGLAPLAGSTWNKYRQTVLHLQRWARKKGYLANAWLSEDTTIRRQKGARRDRRLRPDIVDAQGRVQERGEESCLLEHAAPWLQRLIVAALETCCRRGELLSLQWRDVDLARGRFRVRAEKAKSAVARDIPISARLRGVLQMIRYDPRGQEHPPEAFVFGDALGGQVQSPKRAWATAVLKAHGVAPTWTRNNALSAESSKALTAIDLHFHDLRHEGASRLLERGWPLQHVQGMLGHADAKTTSIYLNVTFHQLAESMRRMDSLHTVAPPAPVEHSPLRNVEPPTGGNVLVN